MTLKFCANISFMFQEEASLLKRYALASQLGFKGVECAFPYDFPVQEVTQAKRDANVKQVLINTPITKDGVGKFGLASIPGKEADFMNGFKEAVKYAKALESDFIHIMSGTSSCITEANNESYISNLKLAVDILEKENITALIEPINKYSVPDYYMNSYEKAVNIIKEINSDNIKLMLDIFHMQQIRGNLTRSLKELLPLAGHIQIAQVPDRHEPDQPGEIDYKYILKILEEENYKGWIGLEYKPLNLTSEGLKWTKNLGYTL